MGFMPSQMSSQKERLRMSKIFKELFAKGKIVFILARIIGSVFCLVLFVLSMGIFAVAVDYLIKAIDITKNESLIHLFDSIGLVVLAVAVLDLATTIFREIILRALEKRHPSQIRRSLTRFGTIIVIATLIEGFIMIFRFSKAGQIHLLPYAALILAGAIMLMIGLGVYLKITIPVERLIEKE
jgi:uncharacterized BrkB/YihY/UPF0761 family membrane protein